MTELPPGMMEELEFIAMEAQRGYPAGPLLCRRIERDVLALLYRARLNDSRVVAEVRDGGLYVTLYLPKQGQRVQRLVVQVGVL